MKNNIYFVSGIDTDTGKSYATGYIAKRWNANGIRTITQKFIQTGNTNISEDIKLHRKLMGIPFTEEDDAGITMPEIFTYPASPHLASRVDNREIDFEKIKQATGLLSERYDAVLLEGAGGLMVPLTDDYLTIDYVKEMGYSLIFVTSGKLGSINHTLLSLEAIRSRGIKLHLIAYNLFPKLTDTLIRDDTEEYIRNYIQKYFPETGWVRIPNL
ncbi:MAG: dethiobiotin synthase [Tannerellaceae bacterium]|jgi:dethiobiotin synthetase|nr:dethiobiotin synthase [Tannerellaceae bacterium]